MTTTMRPGWLHSALHMKLATMIAALAVIGFAIGGAALLWRAQHEQFVIPDEKAAAATLLGQKLSGPRYFQTSASADSAPLKGRAQDLRDGEPFISVADALA